MKLGIGPTTYLASIRAYWNGAPNASSFRSLCKALGATTKEQRTHVSDALQYLQRRYECHYAGHGTWRQGVGEEKTVPVTLTMGGSITRMPEPEAIKAMLDQARIEARSQQPPIIFDEQPRLPMSTRACCPYCESELDDYRILAMLRNGKATLTLKT